MKTSWIGSWRRRIFGITAGQLCYRALGFRDTDSRQRERVECIAATFAEGYHAALECREPAEIPDRCRSISAEWKGFAIEGAGMGLALRDWVGGSFRDRVGEFLAADGAPHTYMIHVGVGWALARLPARVAPLLSRRDPLLRWLILDGWGFHDGFFRTAHSVGRQAYPRRLGGYARRAYDQGLGRALCFVEGGSAQAVAQSVARFPAERRSDLWSGVGLAAAYSGVIDVGPEIEILRRESGLHSVCLAQGAAFAAKARLRAGNPTQHTQLVVSALCGLSMEEAAGTTDDALENLSRQGDGLAYETWRNRVQASLAARALHLSPRL